MIAIDIDPIKIEYARHNAAIYGVDDRIDFMNGDSFSLAPKLKVRIYMIIVQIFKFVKNVCINKLNMDGNENCNSYMQADIVFMSPPWGGPAYSKVKKFDINTMLKPREGYCSFFGDFILSD